MSKAKTNRINNSKLKVIGNENTSNIIDNSINNIYYNISDINYNSDPVDSVNNSNIRTLLQRKVGERIQIWAYAIDTFKTDDKYVKYTIINIHNKDNYIADHIQLAIPHNIFNDDIHNKIIMVDGIVYEYDSRYGKKQSIIADKVNISYCNDLHIHEDLIKQRKKLSDDEAMNVALKLQSFTAEEKFNLLTKYIDILNNLVPGMPRNFISNYIINQYTINNDPESINRADLNILRNDEKSIIDILFIIGAIINMLSTGNAQNISNIFIYINWILNSMHGFPDDENMKNKSRKKVNSLYTKEFRDFCTDHNLNINRAYKYILTRNLDFDGGVLHKSDACKKALEILYPDLMNEEKENETKFYIKK